MAPFPDSDARLSWPLSIQYLLEHERLEAAIESGIDGQDKADSNSGEMTHALHVAAAKTTAVVSPYSLNGSSV